MPRSVFWQLPWPWLSVCCASDSIRHRSNFQHKHHSEEVDGAATPWCRCYSPSGRSNWFEGSEGWAGCCDRCGLCLSHWTCRVQAHVTQQALKHPATREGAMAYFVGPDPDISQLSEVNKGLPPIAIGSTARWRITCSTDGQHGQTPWVCSHSRFQRATRAGVEKTWGYLTVRVLHHSSAPFDAR